jgi:hypothetical protein
MLVIIGGTKPDSMTQGVMNLQNDHGQSSGINEVGLMIQYQNLLSKAVSPQVLVHGDGYHERTSDGLVRIYSVSGDHGGKAGDLDSGAGVADDNDDLPPPFVLVAEGGDEVAEHHDKNIRDCRETLSDDSIFTTWKT